MKKVLIFFIMLIFACCYAYAQISANLQPQFNADMEAGISHVLNDKITYEHTTLIEMLDKYNKESDSIYKSYLTDKNNIKQNKIYAERLNEINGTISFYSDAICTELKPITVKYKIELEPGTNCDVALYKEYIENSSIKNAKGFKKLIDYHKASFQKIHKYKTLIFDEF